MEKIKITLEIGTEDLSLLEHISNYFKQKGSPIVPLTKEIAKTEPVKTAVAVTEIISDTPAKVKDIEECFVEEVLGIAKVRELLKDVPGAAVQKAMTKISGEARPKLSQFDASFYPKLLAELNLTW